MYNRSSNVQKKQDSIFGINDKWAEYDKSSWSVYFQNDTASRFLSTQKFEGTARTLVYIHVQSILRMFLKLYVNKDLVNPLLIKQVVFSALVLGNGQTLFTGTMKHLFAHIPQRYEEHKVTVRSWCGRHLSEAFKKYRHHHTAQFI